MEIKICSACGGTGEKEKDVGTHTSEWKCYTCSKCNGTGRVKTQTYSYSVPFSMDDNEIYKVDSEIFNLIRKLESGRK